MKTSFFYSTSTHILIFLILFFLLSSHKDHKKKQYFIDFIGNSPIQTIQTENTSLTKKNEEKNIKKEKPYFDKDSFFKEDIKLTPSMGNEKSKVLDTNNKSSSTNISTNKDENNYSSFSGINTDSDFPYPWYITQVRELLWDSWQAMMPTNSSLKCIIKFKIMRNGSAKDIEIETSSGNRTFDQSAILSVKNVGKFPYLPDDFYEDFLNIHVEFKNIGG